MIRASLHVDLGKFEGVILGTAVGDALGWPHEDRARRASALTDNAAQFDSWIKRSGGRFQPHEERIDPGSYSDDTQLSIAVARSRLRGNSWWKYLAFVEFPFWTVYHRGAGGASLRAAALLVKRVLPWESAAPDRKKYFDAGGNGVAMRVAPHCLLGCLDDNFSATATNVMTDGVLTHGHPTALVGALAYAYALWSALRKTGTLEYGQLLNEVRSSSEQWARTPSLSERWSTWEKAVLTQEYQSVWLNSVKQINRQLEIASEGLVKGALDFDDEVLKNIGCFDRKISGAGTVAAAAAIFLGSKYAVSPMEGVARAALAKGADTDTIASMTGAIAGAVNGVGWLSRIVPQLQDYVFLTSLAHALQNEVQGRRSSFAPATTEIRSILASLSQGERTVNLPIGSTAHVIGDGGATSKSDKLQVRSWKLEDESGQTFFIKQLKKQTKPQTFIAQKKFDLDFTVGPHGKFAGISLFARNLEESRRFYCELLGLPIKRDTETLVALGEHLVLRKNSFVRAVGEGSIVYVDVDNINQCWLNLRSLRYAQVSSIEKKSNRPSFTCKDPDGRTVEVFQR